VTRMALSRDQNLRGHFNGTSACLSALYRAERYREIVSLLEADTIWPYRQWAVKALAAMGRKAEAIRYAESGRGPWTHDGHVDALCEEILLSSGLAEEAYARYGLTANRRGTYLATFRPSRRSTRTRRQPRSWPTWSRPLPVKRASGSPRPRKPGSTTKRSPWLAEHPAIPGR